MRPRPPLLTKGRISIDLPLKTRLSSSAWAIILTAACFCFPPTATAQNPSPPYESVFFWVPRYKDIAAKRMDAESNVLQFVLAHSRSRQLVVRKGDSIDLILRTELYVSSKNQPIAYRLYKDEFLRRNPRVEARTGLGLLENETISIPSGPRYSALHIERMLATIDRIGQGKTAELDFR